MIAVGGTYVEVSASEENWSEPQWGISLESSNYALGGFAPGDPNRAVPDVCGIVGRKEHGVLIKLPVPPRCEYDTMFYQYDGTTPYDGWMVASGTSSATPQVVGVAAFLIQKNKESINPKSGLDLARWVKNAIIDTARDVTVGARTYIPAY